MRIPGDIGFTVKGAHGSHGIALRNLLAAFGEAFEVIDGFGLPAKRHFDIGVGIEFDDHAGAFVDHPHVVVFIDADGVCKRGSIVIRAPQFYEL